MRTNISQPIIEFNVAQTAMTIDHTRGNAILFHLGCHMQLGPKLRRHVEPNGHRRSIHHVGFPSDDLPCVPTPLSNGIRPDVLVGIESSIKPRKKIPIIIGLIQLLIANQDGMEVKGRATIDFFQDIRDRTRLAEGTNGGQTIGTHREEGSIAPIHRGRIGQGSKGAGDIGSRLMGTCNSGRFASRRI